MTTIFPSTRLKFVSGLPRVECQRRSLSSTSRRKSHYETLGIPNDASKAQIKSSFYRLSKLHHPDLSKDPGSPDKFTKLNEAYQVLISDRERRAYDRSLLHRGPSGDHYQRYTPHGPPSKSPRATYAWKGKFTAKTARGTYTYSASSNPFQAGRKPPPPDYDFTAGRQRPGPNPYHDVLSGSRKRYEEAERAADLVRNESFFLRAVQLTGVIAVPILLLGGFGPGVW
ncbi:DnaJ-domain-containing protein [Coprinellus micaceus]|uniref:DnaJ-domain-containing protein n=1 Tax=Coprinellus micaceus TaxID=71717 RepID=A0A4Y7SS64_COPMI|nr:DnaJ-domain-containing protein [Coprinellus micaceus]